MESTTRKSINYTSNNFMGLGAMQGWQCPICKRVLAPFMPECPCGGQGTQTIINTISETVSAEDFIKQQEESLLKFKED